MKTKIVKEKEQETVLSKKNYIILIIGSILIIAGYILMSGEGSTLAIIQKAGHSPSLVLGSLMLASILRYLKLFFPFELILPE